MSQEIGKSHWANCSWYCQKELSQMQKKCSTSLGKAQMSTLPPGTGVVRIIGGNAHENQYNARNIRYKIIIIGQNIKSRSMRSNIFLTYLRDLIKKVETLRDIIIDYNNIILESEAHYRNSHRGLCRSSRLLQIQISKVNRKTSITRGKAPKRY